MNHSIRTSTWILAGILAVAASSPAAAQIANGSFDGGLAGWTATTVGSGDATVMGTGNPAPGAWLWNSDDGAGSTTLAQTFNCGGNGDGMCFLSLEYATDVTGAANMNVTVELDDMVVYSAVHPGTVSTYTPVLFSAPCGEHTIEITAGSTATWPFAHWMMILDNVTASCVPPVSTEGRSWSSLKATYR